MEKLEKVRIFHWAPVCEKVGKLPSPHGKKESE